MDSTEHLNTHNGGNISEETSGQQNIVMASTDSESMAKLTPPREDIVSPLSNSEKADETVNKTTAMDGTKQELETHGASLSSDWQHSTEPMLIDNIDGSNNLNPSKLIHPTVVSPPLDTPSSSLQNLDDLKGSKKKASTSSSFKEEDITTPQQLPSKQRAEVAPKNQSSRMLMDHGDVDETSRKKKEKEIKFKMGKDFYCWTCHKDKANVSCSTCPRSYHPKCLLSSGFQHSSLTGNSRKSNSNSHDITCPECKTIEAIERRPPKALKSVSKEELNSLLLYAIESVKPSADPSFHSPVIKTMFPDYFENIIHPTDFQTIETKVKSKQYTSTEAFLSDMKWIIHNCCIYNNSTHPLTSNAKSFMKLMITKIVDLEICPDCFKNYHIKPKTWFTEVCRKPHAIVWAKVVGHPFWPGKVVQIDPLKKEADVRFFGAHDRAWLPVDQCFLLTENNCKSKSRNSRSKFDVALKELNEHISKIESKLNIKFPYAESPKLPVEAKKPFVRLPKKEGEVSSEEEEEQEDIQDDVEAPELQIDESVKGPTDDESETSKQSYKNGSTADISEPDLESPPKQKSAKKRKLTLAKVASLEDSKNKKLPPKVLATPEVPTPNISVKSVKSDTWDPLTDLTPVEEKDIITLRKEVERLREMVKEEKQKCFDQLKEERKKSELAIVETKKEFQKEKEKALRDQRSKLEAAHAIQVSETKKQQWCAQCAQPAVYYCCWNTSYCSYDCQNNHWQFHMNTCQQSRQAQQQQTIR